jgi:putative ABC transport system substrate-binding protein
MGPTLPTGLCQPHLRGTKPGDLPVQFASRFYYIINLKTAKEATIKIPPTPIALAEKEIE